MTEASDRLEEQLRDLKENVEDLLEKLDSPDDADEDLSYMTMEVATGERQTIVHWIELPITADGTTYSNAADVATFADAEAIFLKAAQDRDESNASATHDRNVSHGDIMVLGSRPNTWICYVAKVDRYDIDPRWGFQLEDPTAGLLALTETVGTDSHANREFIIWTNKTGTCDPDTYDVVGEDDEDASSLASENPPDTDTNFDDGSVTDVKVSTPSHCENGMGEPLMQYTSEAACNAADSAHDADGGTAWVTSTCVRKTEFDNKKLLQNDCKTAVLQEDASGGQADDTFTLATQPQFVPLWGINTDELGSEWPAAQKADLAKMVSLRPIGTGNPADHPFLGCMIMLPPDLAEAYNVNPCCDWS